MSAGAGGFKFIAGCDYLYRSIHACPSDCCNGDSHHYIRIRLNLREQVCERYVNGCCLDEDCKKIHCMVSAQYRAEQIGLSIDPKIKKEIWNMVLTLCSMNIRYYQTIVNSMNEILELTICRGIRNIISQYIGNSWHIMNAEETDRIYQHNPPRLFITSNKRICRTVHRWSSCIWNTCCIYNYTSATYISIKKVDGERGTSESSGVLSRNGEYSIAPICNKCYNHDDPNALYNIGLDGFRVFRINDSCVVNEPDCIIKLDESDNLEVVKFDGQN